MINDSNKYVRFDWAAKRILHNKDNFGVLEGLISVLLEEEVKIKELLKNDEDDPFNRVDVVATNSKDEKIIVEIQQMRHWFYLLNIAYAKATLKRNLISLDKKNVDKIYSINIFYFNIGKGEDCVYRGTDTLKGIYTGDTLQLKEKEKLALSEVASGMKPAEYIVIRANSFDMRPSTPLEEWLDYLKNGHIKDDTTAQGLEEAKERLQYMQMSKQEQRAYDSHIDAVMTQNDVLYTYWQEGMMEGRKIAQKEKDIEIAQEMKKSGMDTEMIKKYTKLTDEEIEAIPIGN